MKLNKLSIYLVVIGLLFAIFNLNAQKVVRYDLHVRDTLVNFTNQKSNCCEWTNTHANNDFYTR
jgi:hypothetical protein